MRNRGRSRIIINQEIDYTRLAQAIVKANQEADLLNEEQQKQMQSGKVYFFKSLWLILRGKIDTEDYFTAGIFSSLLSALFRILSLIGLIIFISGLCFLINLVIQMDWAIVHLPDNIVKIIVYIALLFLIATFAFIFYVSSREVLKSKDKSFIVSVFSGVVSLIALIISLVALLK